MTPRNKRNMLEAFRDGHGSSESQHAAQAPRRFAGAGDSGETAGGPLVRDARQGSFDASARSDGSLAGHASTRSGPDGEGALGARGSRSRGEGLPLLVPGAFVILLVGFWLGRVSSGWWGPDPASPAAADLTFETRVVEGGSRNRGPAEPVGAANSGGLASFAATDPVASAPHGSPVAGSAGAEDGYTADDLAFLDKRNRVTLRAITFDATSLGQQKALKSYLHLRSQGIPAVAPFVVGDLTLICVGAAPSVRDPELARLRERLLTLPGPPPQAEPTPYASAFLVNIEDLVLRD
jgi:hypothetical protein